MKPENEYEEQAAKIQLHPTEEHITLLMCMRTYRSSRGADGRGALRWILKYIERLKEAAHGKGDQGSEEGSQGHEGVQGGQADLRLQEGPEGQEPEAGDRHRPERGGQVQEEVKCKMSGCRTNSHRVNANYCRDCRRAHQ